jgi:two-component system chemotaxis sensor kinase CheA
LTANPFEEGRGAFDRIAVAVLTASREDMRMLGEVLSAFEEIGREGERRGWADVSDAARVADALGSALMFDDDARARWDEALEIFSRLTRCCQEAFRSEGRLNRPELARIFSDARERLHVHFEGIALEEEAAVAPEADPVILLDQEKELYSDFVGESKEHLEAIEVGMVDLEANPDDREILNTIFRAFHTIKGVSGFLNLGDVNDLAHRTENLLDLARKGELPVTADVIDVVFGAVDAMRGMLDETATLVAAGEPSRRRADLGRIFFRIDGILEGREGAPVPPTVPPKLGQVLVEQGMASPEMIEEALEVQEWTGGKTPLGKILVEEKKVNPRDVAQAIRLQKAAAAGAYDIRVNVHKLDGLVDMVGELVIAQSLVTNDPDVRSIESQRFYRNLSQLGRITSELQKISMSLRMVPIRNTFQKMARMVRDLARKSGKEVTLEVEGEDTEIDRNMIEEIHDPLVHMIRNAVDHGIETPEVRLAAEKPACGVVTLRAFHHGGRVVIGIEDDGKGLDPGRILAKAVERGIVAAGPPPPESEVLNLIFEPGFSTAEKVTDISGRGVGLDVVKRNVEKLRGTIETRSVIGAGTSFQLKLPLTLAIIDGIVLRVGEQRYILPTSNIVEALRPRREDCYTVERRGEVIRVREELLPLVRLRSLFSIPGEPRPPWEALVVVLENEGEKRTVLVDELLGKQEVVIKSLGGGVHSMKGVSGGAILGDGRVGLIIDVPGIFEMTGRAVAYA